ncbi:MAG: FecR domain-containing protein [Bacteroidales bacterium]|jgi:ferric-dicitrate binding protein FerR (iron transport regulator)
MCIINGEIFIKDMNDEILKRYIKGIASAKEREIVMNWIEENEQNAKVFHSKKTDWVFDNFPDKDAPSEVCSGIRKKIKPGLSYKTIFMRAAAIVVLPLTLFAGYQYYSYSQKLVQVEQRYISAKAEIPAQNRVTMNYEVNPGVKGLVELPDGSKVWLNSHSNLKCPDKFDSTFRMVELSGEGYFKVVSNKEWPMYVKTSKGITVKVTGTEFNLSSYDNDNELKFTLVSGSVTLIRESNKQEIAVNTKEEVVIPDNARVKGKRMQADIVLNTAWKDGYLIFDNTPIEEVIKKMERWYGVSFVAKDPELLKYNFTANFKSESITQVLELLKITSNISYSIKDNRVTLFFR